MRNHRALRLPVLLALLALDIAGVSSNIAFAAPNERMTVRQMVQQATRQFHLYRGKFLERVSDRIMMGRNRFDPTLSIQDNLRKAAKENGLHTYMGKVKGRDVLHIVVDLADGKRSKKAVRAVMAQVGKQTIELNFKKPNRSVPTGHTAVRVGDGAWYDMTGTRGVTQLPPLVKRFLSFVQGSSEMTFVRRRNMRRFMESRRPSEKSNQDLYYGLLFAADGQAVKSTGSIYDARMEQAKTFSLTGGDSKEGVYSCAQYLSEDVPFFNERGVNRTVGARAMSSMAGRSEHLEAVIVYRMPEATAEPTLDRL